MARAPAPGDVDSAVMVSRMYMLRGILCALETKKRR
jgi:hypothetical protein